jgi:hypothetical protein
MNSKNGVEPACQPHTQKPTALAIAILSSGRLKSLIDLGGIKLKCDATGFRLSRPHELGLPRFEAVGPTHVSAGGALCLGLSFRAMLRIGGHEPGPNGWNESGKSCVATGITGIILVVVTHVNRCEGTYLSPSP